MAGILDLFSKRKKRTEMAGKTEPYSYDSIPQEFRTQVIHMWNDVLEDTTKSKKEQYCEIIHQALAKEYGVFELGHGRSFFQMLSNFILQTEADRVIDIVELTFRSLDPSRLQNFGIFSNHNHNNLIDELNARFEQWSIGYEFIDGEIFRKDSKFVHKEITIKALELLHEEGFEGASDEFLKGHKHYREKNYKEAANNALKAFESTMKTICKRKKWKFKSHDSSKKLLEIMFENDLIPSSLQTHFASLRTTLEAGLPTIRNKQTAHGQGENKVIIPRYLAQYALNLAATNIVFLVESSK